MAFRQTEVAVGNDITRRKSAERALLECERRMLDMLDDMELLAVTVDLGGRVTYCNAHFLTLTGWKDEEVLGRDYFELFAPPQEVRGLFGSLLAGSPPARHHENTIVTRSGARLLVRWNNSVLRSAEGEAIGVAGIGEDVTQKRKTEAELRQSQKIEGIGRLAGGIAHDFNNVLTAISGYSQFLLDALAPGDPKRGDVLEIKSAGARGAALTRQLLAFSRRQKMTLQPLDLNAIIGGLEKMLRCIIRESIELVFLPGKELGRVRADAGQIEQLVVNLCVNAKDAMLQGGRLTVETTNEELSAEFARAHLGCAAGAFVRIKIGDTGCGMTAEVAEHLFEPFFTTKEPGRGTGLGLATVYGIVKQSGGCIYADSVPGRGTTFEIYFPRVDAALAQPEKGSAPARPARGVETILLVEDDSMVRRFAARVLAQEGYTLLTAASPKEAIGICEKRAEPIDAMVSDVVMPGMSGFQLAERLRALKPGMKAVFMSDYAEGTAGGRPGLLTATILEKPVMAQAMVRTLREALDASARGGPAAGPARP